MPDTSNQLGSADSWPTTIDRKPHQRPGTAQRSNLWPSYARATRLTQRRSAIARCYAITRGPTKIRSKAEIKKKRVGIGGEERGRLPSWRRPGGVHAGREGRVKGAACGERADEGAGLMAAAAAAEVIAGVWRGYTGRVEWPSRNN
jgi:hypothetical protein